MNEGAKSQRSPWLDFRRKRFWAVVAVIVYTLAGFFLVPALVAHFGEKQIEPESVEAVIEKQQSAKEKTTAKGAGAPDKNPARADKDSPPEPAQRYIYSDGKGGLHFADSLEEVPEEYRGQAQPMAK